MLHLAIFKFTLANMYFILPIITSLTQLFSLTRKTQQPLCVRFAHIMYVYLCKPSIYRGSESNSLHRIFLPFLPLILPCHALPIGILILTQNTSKLPLYRVAEQAGENSCKLDWSPLRTRFTTHHI